MTKKEFSTLFAANEVVGLRFTGKLPEGKEALEGTFALTPEEKAEFADSLNSVDAAQLQQLFLQVLKQALGLAALHSSRNAVNEGVSASSDPLASRGPLGRRERSELSQNLEVPKSEIANNDAVCSGIPPDDAPPVPVTNTQKSEIKNPMPTMEEVNLMLSHRAGVH